VKFGTIIALQKTCKMPSLPNAKPEDKYSSRKGLDECRKILYVDEEGYSDEEVFLIRDFLLAIVELDYLQYQKIKEQRKVIVELKTETDAQSNIIHPGEHRRAS
jgi:hypothetical protein